MSKKALVAIIAVLAFMLLGLGTYVAYDKFIKPNNTKENKKEEKKEETKKESILIDEDKDVVYTVGDNSYYKKPYINIKTDDATEFNKLIDSFAGDSSKYNEDVHLNYIKYTNGDVISLITYIKQPMPVREYLVLNINTKTGKRVSNSNLLESKKVESSSLNDKILYIYDNKDGIETDKEMTSNNGPETIYEANVNTIKSNKVDSYDMYLNDNGDLCAIVDLQTFAGSGHSVLIFNVTKNVTESLNEKTN